MVVMNDITGKRFGKLLAIQRTDNHPTSNRVQWICKCDCGKLCNVVGGVLVSNKKRSCGCKCEPRHLDQRELSFSSWRAMIQRCYSEKAVGYHNYGGRGITVCKSWRDSFTAFVRDVGLRPSRNYQIDRIDNNGNYEPGNCKWSTRKENSNNSRLNVVLEHDGQKLTIAQWIEKTGISRAAIHARMKNNWPISEVLTKPVDKHQKRKPKRFKSKATSK